VPPGRCDCPAGHAEAVLWPRGRRRRCGLGPRASSDCPTGQSAGPIGDGRIHPAIPKGRPRGQHAVADRLPAIRH
jgi:hypothetical protein